MARTPDGTAVGCGGLRPLAGGGLEVNRMYVVPELRGHGVATAILRRVEQEALVAGCEELLLETGTEQPDAMRFYEREGYHRIPAFGAYVGEEQSVCHARRLSRATTFPLGSDGSGSGEGDGAQGPR